MLVCEPTRRGVGVYRQYAEHARAHDVALAVLGNTVAEPADVDSLRAQVGGDLLGWLTHSQWVRAAERGDSPSIADLDPADRAVLHAVRDTLDGRPRDWAAYHRATVAFHLRSALGARATGTDLAAQVDPEFVPGPVAARSIR